MIILIPYILQFQHLSSGDDESWVEHYLERKSAKHWGGYGTTYMDCLVVKSAMLFRCIMCE